MQRVHRLTPLPPRPRTAHKRDMGAVLVVGGSHGMTGAPLLAGRAALIAGAGLVTIAAPAAVAAGLEARAVETMTLSLEDEDGILGAAALQAIIEASRRADVVVVGCGLGHAGGLEAIIEGMIHYVECPMVFDADGLRTIAGANLELKSCRVAPILTPHPGEMAALAGVTTRDVQEQREGVAASYASRARAVVALKGDRTVVSDGKLMFVNHTGNPGMASAGAGDVLAGLVGALVARGLTGFAAAQLGVYLHGLAGDLAARRASQESVIAGAIIESLPAAIARHLSLHAPRA